MIAPVTLTRLYAKHGVKRKKVRMIKELSLKAQNEFEDNKQRIISDLQHARDNQMQVVYMDEVVFSKRGFPTRCYSNKGVNTTVKQRDVYSGFRTVIAAVNSDFGLVLTDSKEIVTNEERILEFIPKLSLCMGSEAFALYMDNLKPHKTPAVMKLYEQYQILPIFNIADSPDLNAIEICFSVVKLSYKQ